MNKYLEKVAEIQLRKEAMTKEALGPLAKTLVRQSRAGNPRIVNVASMAKKHKKIQFAPGMA